MNRHPMLPSFVCLSLVLLLAAPWPPAARAAAPPAEGPDLGALVTAEAERLRSLSSPADAQALFASRIAALAGLAPVVERTKAIRAASEDVLAKGGRFTAELAAWQLARTLKEAADLPDARASAELPPLLERQQWLLGESREALDRAAKLLGVIGTLSDGRAQVDGAPYAAYAAFLDRTYPQLAETDQAWLHLALDAGAAGVRQRLESFWQGRDEPIDQGLMARYFDTRLRPVLMAQAAAFAIRAEALAERDAQRAWRELRDWIEIQRERKGLARLCGTWQWTVHNHKNHQDQKMLLAFPAPEVLTSPQAAGLRPAKAVVLGDAVYLRWEFQGGVQEDSLLFSSEGQRLEGTFTNSAGGWGSISGKRTAGCEAQGKR